MLEHIHDVRLVRPPQVSALAALAGDRRELGHRIIEYCLAVPANRYGYGTFTGVQLKTIQEIVTLAVFTVFAIVWPGEGVKWNHLAAFGCRVAAAFFIFWE